MAQTILRSLALEPVRKLFEEIARILFGQALSAEQSLTVRSEPYEQATIVGEIAGHANGLLNLGCEGGPSLDEWLQMNEEQRQQAAGLRWCKISYGQIEGWVAGRFVAEASEPTLDDIQEP